MWNPSCFLLLVACAFGLFACSDQQKEQLQLPAHDGSTVHPALTAVLPEFEKKIYEVTEGVYQAVGYAAANSILIEGDEGVIIVDVSGSVERGREVREAFREITDKPIKALIYTHNHGDHVFGGPGFVPDGDVDVYAHETTNYYINRVTNVTAEAIGPRSTRMIGALLPRGDEGYVHYGVGPFVETAMPGEHLAVLRPNKTFSDRMEVTIAGVRIVLVHAPGETDDQLFVWLPDKKVLMPGDNVYKSFPNLYTLRGTHYRDVAGWYRSIDKMRALEPEFLAPSHTLPIRGREEVMEVLTAYRDGIQFVHDQTIRGMNRGLTPDELVEVVKLPPHLANHPYLFEYYGKVEWSVRAIFDGYLGWYDGDVAKLMPPSLIERAQGMAQLAGGEEALGVAARRAIDEEQFAWALELASHLNRLAPEAEEPRRLMAEAARVLGYRSHNANARNLYLTAAMELSGAVALDDEDMREKSYALIKALPVRGFLEALPVHLNPENSLDRNEVLGIRFTDLGEAYSLHVRRGVAVLEEGFPAKPDHAMTTTAEVWLEIMAGRRSLPAALATGDIELQGGRLQIPSVLGFLAMFRP